MTFQQKIIYVRKKFHMSQEDLARELSVSFATLHRWEKQGSKPSRLGLKAFEEFCDKRKIVFPIEVSRV